jgi:hypothetical protein
VTREDILKMMNDAGMPRTKYAPAFHRLVEIAMAAEREACAEVCDHIWMHSPVECEGADQCADAIRARGQE